MRTLRHPRRGLRRRPHSRAARCRHSFRLPRPRRAGHPGRIQPARQRRCPSRARLTNNRFDRAGKRTDGLPGMRRRRCDTIRLGLSHSVALPAMLCRQADRTQAATANAQSVMLTPLPSYRRNAGRERRTTAKHPGGEHQKRGAGWALEVQPAPKQVTLTEEAPYECSPYPPAGRSRRVGRTARCLRRQRCTQLQPQSVSRNQQPRQSIRPKPYHRGTRPGAAGDYQVKAGTAGWANLLWNDPNEVNRIRQYGQSLGNYRMFRSAAVRRAGQILGIAQEDAHQLFETEEAITADGDQAAAVLRHLADTGTVDWNAAKPVGAV